MYSRDELKVLRKDFWDTFGRRCEIVPELQGRRKKWILHRTDLQNTDLKFEVGRKVAHVILELNHRNENQRIFAFEVMKKYKLLLEEGFEEGLTWDFSFQREESGQMVCRIYTSLSNIDFHKRSQWPEIYNFFIDNMLKLERNLIEIKELVEEDMKAYER